jgi:hypothetical protein
MTKTTSALLSPVACTLEFFAPAEELDQARFPYYARPARQAVLCHAPRAVRVGMRATGSNGERLVLLRITADCGDAWATVRRIEDDSETEVPLSSLH